MSAYRAFLADARAKLLPERKFAAIESILRDIDAILNGDANFPTLWDHISDEAMAASGAMPFYAWKDQI